MSENNFKTQHTIGYKISGKPIKGGSDALKSKRRDNAELERKFGGNYSKRSDKQPQGPKWDPPKTARGEALKYEAGSGSVPSGTNTHLPGKYGKRKDGSFGIC
jgi:hypothetical protein